MGAHCKSMPKFATKIFYQLLLNREINHQNMLEKIYTGKQSNQYKGSKSPVDCASLKDQEKPNVTEAQKRRTCLTDIYMLSPTDSKFLIRDYFYTLNWLIHPFLYAFICTTHAARQYRSIKYTKIFAIKRFTIQQRNRHLKKLIATW